MPTLVELAPAKVNLTLAVLGRRADGYHLLDSLVVFAGIADRLTLAPGPALSLKVGGATAEQAGPLDDNLVLKAVRALAAETPGLKLGRFTLEKHLPVAAGLGGGSSDAAAALRLLARANRLARNNPKLIKVAPSIGADVPVCVASRACDMTGVGEGLLPLDLPEMPAVLVNPRVPVATKDVFNALGLRHGELLIGATDVVMQAPSWPAAGRVVDDWIAALRRGTNDLEAPAARIEPVISDVLSALRTTGNVRLVRMSGSGATCFAIYATDADAQAAGERLRALHPGWWVHAGTLS
ncbi:4-(cytidine 5'-diphospho)-2-C-methyl-D-erythritol kinase [uncultured Bradyrhizobium sp.]|uniref:4-(cytidine 5'-diphospho)-2-C-methyl-D-erythritol kinase n=1 Tax=uncultured Bradyrhizobium sp. TaxID=199684 RepID=UPI0026138669|nr:4-(cytidine 5'-diphospho)-2-C-methyl-D-erythritol kinase [uncultured Bradyrhizobium sp.]